MTFKQMQDSIFELKGDKMLIDFFLNNQQHKNYISVDTPLAYLKWQITQNVEKRNS